MKDEAFWEYKIVTLTGSNRVFDELCMNECGQSGWELVNVATYNGYYTAYFKRGMRARLLLSLK